MTTQLSKDENVERLYLVTLKIVRLRFVPGGASYIEEMRPDNETVFQGEQSFC